MVVRLLLVLLLVAALPTLALALGGAGSAAGGQTSGQQDEAVEQHTFWASEMGGGPSFDNCTLCKRNKNIWPTILAKIDNSPTWRDPTPTSINLTESVLAALEAGKVVPPGHKVIYVAQSFGGGNEHPADNIGSNESLSSCPGAGAKPMYFNGLWWDHGAAAVGAAWTAWLRAYTSSGGSVDGVMLDMETGFSVWAFLADPHADSNTVKCKQQQFDLIQADPRFPPLLAKLVAAGWDATPSTGGAHYLADAFAAAAQNISTTGYNRNMAAWMAVMTEHTNSYFATALFEPLVAANSSAWLANYGDYQFSTDFCSMDFNGFRACDFVNMTAQSVTGTHQSSQIYGEMNNVSRNWAMPGTSTTLRRLENMSRFDFSPFNGLLLDVNFFRMSTLASGSKPNKPFFSYPSFTSGLPGTQCPWCTNVTWLGHIDYWYEAIFHLGLMGADDFFYFAPCYHVNGNTDWPNSCPNMATVEDNEAFSAALAELTALAGYKNRSWIADHFSDWHDTFVLTGMQLPTKAVWRLSADFPAGDPTPMELVTRTDGGVAVRLVNRDGSAVEVDFGPDSRLATPPQGNSVSRVGLWITSKEMPVRSRCRRDQFGLQSS